MADITSLIGDGSIKGKVVITVGENTDMEYAFAVDGEGNLIGAYEYGYNYNSKIRMAFSVRKDPSEEADWQRIYAIDVLANLMGTDGSQCSRAFVSDTELPAGGTYIKPMAISEATDEAGKEHDNRKTQFIRLGLSGKSPDNIYVHTYCNDRNKDRNDYDRLFAKADEAFASLTGIIDLSPGFHLSEIYKHMADGLQSHDLSIATNRMEQDYGNGSYDENGMTADAGADGGDEPYSDFNDDGDDTPFDKLDWNGIIKDNQEDINGEGDDDGGDAAESDDGRTDGDGGLAADAEHPSDVTDGAEDDVRKDDVNAGGDDDDGIQPSPDEPDADSGDGDDSEGMSAGDDDIRGDVRNYLSDKLEDLKNELDRKNRIINESDEAIKGIPDRSDDLDRISRSLDEERAKVASLEDELKTVQREEADNEDKRENLRRAADNAAKSRDGIKADMDWLHRLLGD